MINHKKMFRFSRGAKRWVQLVQYDSSVLNYYSKPKKHVEIVESDERLNVNEKKQLDCKCGHLQNIQILT